MANAAPSIFVAGATGTVGRRLVRRLTARGKPVRAATRSPSPYDGPDGADAVQFNYLERKTWLPALHGIDRAFVLAPPDTAVSPKLASFLEAAADAGVNRVVLMTAMGVDQAPAETPLRRAELALMDRTLDAAILRPNWFMQNFTTFWRGMIDADGVIRLPAGDAATSFIDADDIAATAEAALVEDDPVDEAYTLTGPEALTYHEAASLLSEAWNRNIQYEPVDEEEAHRILTAAGLGDDYADMLIGLFRSVRAGQAAAVTQAVRTVTGRAARSFEDFAARTAEEMTNTTAERRAPDQDS